MPVLDQAELNRRFDYHRPSGQAQDLHQMGRVASKAFARDVLAQVPDSRERSLALTAFEEAMFWFHAAIARDPDLHEPEQG